MEPDSPFHSTPAGMSGEASTNDEAWLYLTEGSFLIDLFVFVLKKCVGDSAWERRVGNHGRGRDEVRTGRICFLCQSNLMSTIPNLALDSIMIELIQL